MTNQTNSKEVHWSGNPSKVFSVDPKSLVDPAISNALNELFAGQMPVARDASPSPSSGSHLWPLGQTPFIIREHRLALAPRYHIYCRHTD
jgi:hypothetical protein